MNQKIKLFLIYGTVLVSVLMTMAVLELKLGQTLLPMEIDSGSLLYLVLTEQQLVAQPAVSMIPL